jgi:uncharacterized protein (DUF433 family)
LCIDPNQSTLRVDWSACLLNRGLSFARAGGLCRDSVALFGLTASVIVEDPETMRGTLSIRGTRIPVELVANMLNQGAGINEILEGYHALDREKIELAPLYIQAFPRRPGQPRDRGQSENQFARPAIGEIWPRQREASD